MSKKLSELKRKEIRCLIIEDFENGNVRKITNQDEIKIALDRYTENEITKVFNPTSKQIKEINGLMDRSLENGKVISNLNGTNMLVSVIPMLTDIEVDLDKEKDVDVIDEIISEPNEVFNQVLLELNKIIMNINLDWIEGLKLINKLPSEVVDALADMKNGEI